MARFMHTAVICTGIFSSFAHKHPAHLSIIGGALLLENIIWCTRIVRCPEFGGCLLFGSRKCIESTGIAVGTLTVVRCGRCPLLGVSVNGGSPVYTSCIVQSVEIYYINIYLIVHDYNNINYYH